MVAWAGAFDGRSEYDPGADPGSLVRGRMTKVLHPVLVATRPFVPLDLGLEPSAPEPQAQEFHTNLLQLPTAIRFASQVHHHARLLLTDCEPT